MNTMSANPSFQAFSKPFPDLPKIIGREALLERILSEIDQAPLQGPSRYLLISDQGGVGKTHLIRHLLNALWEKSTVSQKGKHSACVGETIFAFIDFQSPDTHTEDGLIDVIVDGLLEFVDREWFFDFEVARVNLSICEREPEAYTLQQKEMMRREMISQFITCYDRLVKQFRVVLLFDTMEEFERIEHNLETILQQDPSLFRSQIYNARELDEFRLTPTRNIFTNDVLQRKGTLFILAGRDRERFPQDYDYQWCSDPGEKGSYLPEHAQFWREALGELNDVEAEQLLKDLGVRFEDSQMATMRELLPAFYDKVGRNPIFLVLLAETWRFGTLVEEDLHSRENLETKLVERYLYLSPESVLLLYMAVGIKTYFFDLKMIEILTECTPLAAEGKLKHLRQLRFVRVHADGSVSLQDEFRRLLMQYVWDRRFEDESLKQREERKVMRLLLQYHLEKQIEVQMKIANLIARLQHNPDPEYNEQEDRIREHNAPVLTSLTDYQRAAGQQWTDWQRLEIQEKRLVREMEHLLITIGNYSDESFMRDQQKVFDRHWMLLRSTHNPKDTREQLLKRMIDTAFYAVFGRLPTEEDKKAPDYEDRYWKADHLSKHGLTFCLPIIKIRRRHIQHRHYYEQQYLIAHDKFMELLTVFEDVLNTGLPGIEEQVEILLKAAISATYAKELRYEDAHKHLQEALRLCQESGSDDLLRKLKSEIYREIGWVKRLQWDVEGAKSAYEDALESFDQARPTDRTLAQRFEDFAVVSNNLAFAIRYENAHIALLLCTAAYDIHRRARRQVHMIRTLRTLTVIYRLLGHYEKSLDSARRAVALSERIGADDHLALSLLQHGFSSWYASRQLLNEENQKRFTADALKSLDRAYELLSSRKMNSSVLLVEQAQMYYVLAKMTARLDNDIPKAEEYIRKGNLIAEKEMYRDRYLMLRGIEEDLKLHESSLNYQTEIEQSQKYHRAHQWKKELGIVAHVPVGLIEEVAGNVALREAKESDNPNSTLRFQQAITHFARSFIEIASPTGYGLVVLRGVLDNLHKRFRELRALSSSDSSYRNVLSMWCDRFTELLVAEQDEMKRSKRLKHSRQYDQGYQLIRVERIMNTLVYQTYAPPRIPYETDLRKVADILTGKTKGEPAWAFEQIELLLRQPHHKPADLLTSIYLHYVPDASRQIDHAPDNWPFSLQDWHRFVCEVLCDDFQQNCLSGDMLPLFIKAVARCHYIPGIRALAKYLLSRALEAFGYSDDALQLAVKALEEAHQELDTHLVLVLMNEICRALARHGDYLSAMLYYQGLDEVADKLSDPAMLFEICMTESKVYNAWARVSAGRGAPGLIDELYMCCLEAIEKARQYATPKDVREIELQLSLTNLYWGNAGGWNQQQRNRLQDAARDLEQRDRQLDAFGDHHTRAELQRTIAQILMKNAHKLPDVQEQDIRTYFELARQNLEESLSYGRMTKNRYLEIATLSRLVELKYIRSLEYPDFQIHTLAGQEKGQNPYLFLMQEDPHMRALQDMRQQVTQPLFTDEMLRPMLGTHPGRRVDMPPEGFRHYFGRVELVAGAVAQWCGFMDAAMRHYAEAGILTANSAYSAFNIDIALAFLSDRFLEHEDFQLQQKWATEFRKSWATDEAVNNYYPDLIHFCDLQKRLALLSQQSAKVR